MASLPSIELGIYHRLKNDPEYRRRFFLAEASMQIAKQLIELRERRGLSQGELASRIGTKQPGISRIEQADYRNWSFNMLRRIAETMDARIRVLIEPAEDILIEYAFEERKSDNRSSSAASIQGQDTDIAFLEWQSLTPKSTRKTPLLKTGASYGIEDDRPKQDSVSYAGEATGRASISSDPGGGYSEPLSIPETPIRGRVSVG